MMIVYFFFTVIVMLNVLIGKSIRFFHFKKLACILHTVTQMRQPKPKSTHIHPIPLFLQPTLQRLSSFDQRGVHKGRRRLASSLDRVSPAVHRVGREYVPQYPRVPSSP